MQNCLFHDLRLTKAFYLIIKMKQFCKCNPERLHFKIEGPWEKIDLGALCVDCVVLICCDSIHNFTRL
jgi:hypothetical protein